MHGGKREGAGRPAGSKNRSTSHQNERICELAKSHSEVAIGVLVEVAMKGKTDAARVSAANALLDRAYGRPTTLQRVEMPDLAPQVIELVATL